MKYALICKNLSRHFGQTKALSKVSMKLGKTGMVGILGHSGSGKSTFLNIASMIDDGYEGEIRILGKNPKRMNETERGEFRLSNIGYIFQSFELLELENAKRNVLVSCDAVFNAKQSLKTKKSRDLLRFVDLSGFENQPVLKLSGGQKQRVAIARALANDPQIILADEPSGSLDEKNSHLVFSLLKRISKHALVIVVTHDEGLAKQYCDEGYFFSDGKLVRHEAFNPTSITATSPASIYLPIKEGDAKPTLRYLFHHSFAVLKAKKYRSLVSLFAVSLGLLGVGLSTFLTSTIKEELAGAFSTIVPENVITMSSPSMGGQTISNVYAAKEEDALYLAEQYPEYIKGVGASVQINYESWFTDANMFTFLSGATQAVLPGFSARTINDFLWMEDYDDLTFYPKRPAKFDGIDEVVIGLPYSAMSNLCYGLHILRNYESLGEFIGKGKLHIMLSLARYEWEFDDVELFTVIGVTQTEFPCIFHQDHDFNRKFFLDHLNFKSWLSEETPNPQYAMELPYVSLQASPEELIPLLREDERLEHIIFELASPELLPSVCPIGRKCGVNRIYLYGADKVGSNWKDILEISAKYPKIIGKSPVSQGGYYADASSIAMGFARKFFLCESEEKAKEIIDLYSDLPKETAGLQLEMIDGTVDGSYLSSASNGLRLSCDTTLLSSGVAPVGLEEIALSSALYEEFNKPQEVYLAAEIKQEEVGDSLSRQFQVSRLKVSGVKQSRNRIMYVVSDWSTDFFQIHLGMSAFFLQPAGCVYYLEEDADALEIVADLEKYYPSYRFGSPKDDIKNSMSDTLSYLGTILGIFSFVSLIMSSLLLFAVLSIQMNESRREDEMFFVLGIAKKDIAKGYIIQCMIFIGAGLVLSSLLLLIAQLFARQYIASSFGASSNGMISLTPIGSMTLVGLSLAIIISLLLYVGLTKMDFRKSEQKAS